MYLVDCSLSHCDFMYHLYITERQGIPFACDEQEEHRQLNEVHYNFISL